jgi:hypothetical protein
VNVGPFVVVQLNISWPLIVRLRLFDALIGGLELSWTVRFTLDVPLTVGVPEIVPVLPLIAKPAGSPLALQV